MSPRQVLALTLALSSSACIWDPDFDIDWEGSWEISATWRDTATYPVDNVLGQRNLMHAIAPGALLQAAPDDHDPLHDGGLVAESSNPGVLMVEQEGDDVIGLRAVAEGEATVVLDAQNGGFERSYTFVVESPASSALVAVRDGWIGPVPTRPDEVHTAGLALRPGATTTLGLEMVDAEGEYLSGHDFLTWTWDDSLLSEESSGDWVNALTLRAAGEPGFATVSADVLDYEIRTLGEDESPELRLYEVDDGLEPVGTIESIEAEAGILLIGLGAFDEDERWVLAGTGEELDIEVLEGPEELVQAWDHDLSLHGFSLTACPGEGVIALSYAGATREIEVLFEDGAETPAACD